MNRRKLLSFILLIGLVLGVSGSLSSCKDYDEDGAWKENVQSNKTLLEALYGQVAELKTAQSNCRQQCDKLKERVEKLEGQVSTNTQDIADLNGKIKNLETADSLLQKAINDANARIDSTNRVVNDIKNGVKENKDSIDALRARLADCINMCNNTALRVDGLADSLVNLNNTVVGMQGDIVELYRKAYQDSTAAAEAMKLAHKADSIAEANVLRLNDAEDRLDKVEGRLGIVEDLANANKDAISKLQSQVNALQSLVNLIQEAMRKQVTGILVNGTLNPVFGYYAVPSGDIRSTVLAAYYGNPGQFYFPSNVASDYADPNGPVLSYSDLEITGQDRTARNTVNGTIVTASGTPENGSYIGNAGDMWLTLNPLDVDETGKVFTLVNSRGEKAPMDLTPAEASNDLLSFGYTRASANGLYKVRGTVTPSDASSLTPKVDMQEIKDEVKTLYHDWKDRAQNGGLKVNISQLAGVIYDNVHDVLPALALKTSWTTKTANGQDSAHSVISQYCVAGAAIHPFSFGTLAGKTYTPLPTYSGIEDIDGNIDHISIREITTGSYVADVYDAKGNKIGTFSMTELQDLVNQINGSLSGTQSQVNNMIDNVNNTINEANDKIDKLNEIISRYNKWANRVNGWFSRDGNNDINRSLQPVLFYGSGNELAKLGNTKYGTAILPSGSNLLGTTYTLEMLAPAYMKWVAVTNVWNDNNAALKDAVSAQKGNAALKAALQKANNGTNMNTVLYGTTRSFTLGTLESGKVYEVTYAAVDYMGKNVVRKFYFSGK